MRSILENIPDHEDELAPAVSLVRKVRPNALKKENHAIEQIDELISILRSHPEIKAKWSEYVITVLKSKECLDAFCEAGILPGTTFLAELYRRVIHKLIPEVYTIGDLRTAVSRIFSKKTDSKWLKEVPVEKWSELLEEINIPSVESNVIQEQIANALVILSHRITSLGLEPELSSKMPDIDKLSSPFITQSEEIIHLVQKLSKTDFEYSKDQSELDYKQILVLLRQCEDLLKELRDHRNDFGASISLTYILVRLQQLINRVKLLLKLLLKDENIKHEATILLLYEIVKSEHEKNSVFGYINQNIDLIAYQVAEHGSKTGQHYITQSRSDYSYLFKSSMKGGFIVGFMALFKVLLSYIKMAPFWTGFLYSTNYSWGFVTMQMTHSALATKQPALTAQSMASVIHTDLYNENKLDGIGEMIARVCRSQLVSFAGNLLIVFPMGLLVAFLYQLIFGSPLAYLQKAEHLMHELHPFTSGSLIFASIAGVYLFLAGIISGYIDNVVIYRNIPERIKMHHLLRGTLSPKRVNKISAYIEKNIGGIIGNIFFGFCMGSTAVIGHFFGLNTDVRHITFAAANFGISLVSLDFNVSNYDIIWTIIGIIGIGFFNFMVSFNLAFYVALKARNVVIKDTFKIAGSIWRYVKKHPMAFFLPPKRSTEKLMDLNQHQ